MASLSGTRAFLDSQCMSVKSLFDFVLQEVDRFDW